MEYDENFEGATPRTLRKKSSLKKLTSLGKALRKRLPKTPKSERASGSLSGSDSGSVHDKKPDSLPKRLKKRLSANKATPRRSFSATDLDQLDKPEKDGVEQLVEDVVPVTDSIIPSEDAVRESTQLTPEFEENESIRHPETPVPGEREILQQTSVDARSSSSQHQPPLTEDASEIKVPEQEQPTESLEASKGEDYYDQGVEVIEFGAQTGEKKVEEGLMDAVASVDVGIEETVAASLEQARNSATIVKPEGEVQEEEYFELPPEAASKPREVDLTSMRPEVEEAKEEDEAKSTKPRKRRLRRFLLREAPLSLATLAVGILVFVLKNRA